LSIVPWESGERREIMERWAKNVLMAVVALGLGILVGCEWSTGSPGAPSFPARDPSDVGAVKCGERDQPCCFESKRKLCDWPLHCEHAKNGGNDKCHYMTSPGYHEP
jgi:hypothetical protein